jgi:hypothetical protein
VELEIPHHDKVEERLYEFNNHRIRSKKVPTALVCMILRPIEALYRAFAKYCEDGKHPKDIWIASLFIPAGTEKPHHVLELAEELKGITTPQVFCHEYLFDWEIPMGYMQHEVSL